MGKQVEHGLRAINPISRWKTITAIGFNHEDAILTLSGKYLAI
jgi:hypothetical protein